MPWELPNTSLKPLTVISSKVQTEERLKKGHLLSCGTSSLEYEAQYNLPRNSIIFPHCCKAQYLNVVREDQGVLMVSQIVCKKPFLRFFLWLWNMLEFRIPSKYMLIAKLGGRGEQDTNPTVQHRYPSL